MKYIIDTHILIWHGENSPILTQKDSAILNDPKNVLYVSHASLWELSIKISLGKLKLSLPIDQFGVELLRNGFFLLPFNFSHYKIITTLAHHHGDPFDRMIISQAIYENLPILTHDEKFANYPVIIA